MKKEKVKNIILTFDYELSLGHRSGTVFNCMIRPTDLLIELLRKHQLKGIFFVDTTSIMRMQDESEKHPELNEHLDRIRIQLIQLHREGHYVYHHIHPHWLDAKYLPDEKQWDLSNQSRFSMAALSDIEAHSLITRSKDILEDWIKPSDTSFRAEGFRAGGLFIQPFQKFRLAFEDNLIHYDFSVLKGATCSLSGAYYDYSNAPKKSIYHFSQSIIEEDVNGPFTEIALELIENKGLYKILNSLWFRLLYKNDAFADGKSNQVTIRKEDKQSFLSKFSNSETISFELANPVKVKLYSNYIRHHELTHFISHPKLIGPSHLKSMDQLFTSLRRQYRLESDFKKMLNH